MRLVLVPSLALALAACTPVEPPKATEPEAPKPAIAASFDAARLPGYHWMLSEATAADGTRLDVLFPTPGKPLQLDFAEGRVSVSNTCNRIGGSFSVEGDTLSVGRLMQTEMACADAALMRADAEIIERLQAGGTLRFEPGDVLVLATGVGEHLRFVGKPTAETRYGGPGERMFLEVAAQRVPCPHAMIPGYQCLHVRELAYDDQGVKHSTGEWQFFYEDIEGYTHEPGIRNVLRLDRYKIANPPADGASAAYVLDMVVESEAVTE